MNFFFFQSCNRSQKSSNVSICFQISQVSICICTCLPLEKQPNLVFDRKAPYKKIESWCISLRDTQTKLSRFSYVSEILRAFKMQFCAIKRQICFSKLTTEPPFSQYCFIVLMVWGIHFRICCSAVLCRWYILPTSHFLESVNLVLYLPKHKLAHKRNCLKYLLSGQTLPYALHPSLACVCCPSWKCWTLLTEGTSFPLFYPISLK